MNGTTVLIGSVYDMTTPQLNSLETMLRLFFDQMILCQAKDFVPGTKL